MRTNRGALLAASVPGWDARKVWTLKRKREKHKNFHGAFHRLSLASRCGNKIINPRPSNQQSVEEESQCEREAEMMMFQPLSSALSLLSPPLRCFVSAKWAIAVGKLVMVISAFFCFISESYGEFTLGHRSNWQLSVCPFLSVSLSLSLPLSFVCSNSFMRFACLFALSRRVCPLGGLYIFMAAAA